MGEASSESSPAKVTRSQYSNMMKVTFKSHNYAEYIGHASEMLKFTFRLSTCHEFR